MAGGRRNASFSLSTSSLRQTSSEQEARKPSTSVVKDGLPMIRHTSLPDIPKCSVLTFECIMFLFSVVTLYTQYLNIYRTVFWLPHSHTHSVMNLYLIEPHIVLFILVSMSRRLVWCFVKTLMTSCLQNNILRTSIEIVKWVVLILFILVLGYCVASIIETVTLIQVLALAYPFFIYFFVFSLELTPFLEIIPLGVQPKEDSNIKYKSLTPRLVQHSCLNNSEGIRNETEFLYNYCTKLMTRVVYETMLAVYYTSLTPCFFVPNTLHYDTSWITIHTAFVAITYFMCYFIFCFPARFYDTVHRNVQHLGSWLRISSASNLATPPLIWSSNVFYSKGTVVRHGREFFRAEAFTNSAEPGNSCHSRLYMIFHEVWKMMGYMFSLSLSTCLLYLVYLFTLKQWHQVVGTGFLVFCNYFVLYVLLRDYLVLKNTYQQE